ncbi:uncharacterized protein LOC143284533 isoform X6 [Babylonia areolata]|uniref:uncharacterized protein LOC143284533 isoform X6 n=1 Tax=Babylonia areolata TaxID=304850 RepID=UPI003FCEF8EA
MGWRRAVMLWLCVCFPVLQVHGQNDCDSPDGNCNKVNVAAGKAASMSARYRGSGPASLAVDGNTCTSPDVCVHTLGTTDNKPDWWQVDLGRNYTVTDITIYHRQGGSSAYPHSQRISGVWVYVDNTLCYKFPDSDSIGSERKKKDDITCQEPISGQIVRFAKDGNIHAGHYSFINFCEVQIWVCKSGLYGPQCENECDSDCQEGRCDNYDGTCLNEMENTTDRVLCHSPDGNCNKVNVAAGKEASMSARYRGSGPASLAVDGNTCTSPDVCVHTLGTTDNNPDWWQVDLGRNYTVTDISIYHREGGSSAYPHSQRISGVWVYVDNTLCYKFPDSVSIGSERKKKDDITCQEPISGQIVRFAKDGYIHAGHYSFINFCEVQIWVCKSGLFGPQCENKCDSHCQQGRCDNYDGTCLNGCSEGYYGADCSEQCGQCQNQETCDRHTGRCPHGCQPDYQPPDCQIELESTTERPSCDSPDGNCNKVNVAAGKAASMSARYAGTGPASLAVDGNTSTNPDICVHTLGTTDDKPDWWQVDLGRDYTVTDITIYHREGGASPNPHSQRISGVWIYVDDTLCYKFPNSLSIGSERKEKDDITCQRPLRGRIVRFAKDGYIHHKHYSFINFCEVQIWGCKSGLYGRQCENECDSDCQQGECDNYFGTCLNELESTTEGPSCDSPDGNCNKELESTTERPSCVSPDGNCNKVNVAVGKAASMSARYAGTGPASLAVDGNTSTNPDICVHTLGTTDDKPDWWQVDLGRNYTVTDITIYHREGGASPNPHSQRISGVWIYVDDTLCYKFPNSLSIGSERKEKDDITCQRPVRGRIVRFAKDGYIHHKHYSFINFCEVQIWGCKSGLYGRQCENECDSDCQQGECDNYFGTCLNELESTTEGPSCDSPDGNCNKELESTTERPSCDSPDGNCNKELESTTERPSCESPDGNCNKVNVAVGKAASMSARYAGTGPASLAVDGNTSTNPDICVHTLGTTDDKPDWWQVDLGRNYTVTDITIYHREGGASPNPHSQRISGVWIYVDDALCYKFPNSLSIGSERKEKDDITCQRPLRGRIVRFAKDGYIHHKHYSFINFCEVQIWGCKSGLYGRQCENECDSDCQQGECDNYFGTCLNELESTTERPSCVSPDGNCNKVNVAVGKAASMSARYAGTGPASLAVDGNTSTNPDICVHTLGTTDDKPDWWQVDLGRNYTVTDITIYHREGGASPNPHSQRISGVWIYVDDTLCYKFPNSLSIGSERKEKDDITCQRPLRGQIVRLAKDGYIHHKHYSFINFCEVQIWACKSGLYGPQCENECDSHCQQGGCDNYDGTCLNGCSEGYYGADCSEQCGQCQNQETCDRHTGRCPHGCQPDYQPPDCQIEVKSKPESSLCGAPDGNCNKVNVALGKVASMSAPYVAPNHPASPASLAVDGNTSTYYTSCVHTLGTLDNEPDWWQVDLGRNYTVTDITVYHREGGSDAYPFNQRIAGVWVYVDNSLCYKFPDSADVGNERKEKDDITCQKPITGQIVRFAKDGMSHMQHYSFINICEVQIWACKSGLYGRQCENECDSDCQQGECDNYDGTCLNGCSEGYYGADCSEQCGQCQNQETCDWHTGRCPHGCQPNYQPPDCQIELRSTMTTESPSCGAPDGNCNKVNVAVGKAASMSTPYVSARYSSGPASLAVDGNTSTYYTSCVHTMGTLDKEPDWWQVDLGRNFTVTDITIYHRYIPHPFSHRISGVWVYVDDTLCYKFPSSLNIPRTQKERDDITCQQPIKGRVVRFSKDGYVHSRDYSFINFCEVQIWVCKSGLYGPQCENECDSHCQQGGCDNYDGTCLNGCSEGYYGADCSEQCGQCQNQETCDRHTGRCPHGCQPDYQPPDCQIAVVTTAPRPEMTTTIATQTTATPAMPSPTTEGDAGVLSNISSHVNIPGQRDVNGQHSIGDENSGTSKIYTPGDMAGMAVTMILLGALLGVAGLALYCHFFSRRRDRTDDAVSFSLMNHSDT